MLLHGLACGQPGKPRKSSGKPRLLLQFPAISCRSEDFPVLQESLLRKPAFLLYCKKACRSFSLSFLQIFKLNFQIGGFCKKSFLQKALSTFPPRRKSGQAPPELPPRRKSGQASPELPPRRESDQASPELPRFARLHNRLLHRRDNHGTVLHFTRISTRALLSVNTISFAVMPSSRMPAGVL